MFDVRDQAIPGRKPNLLDVLGALASNWNSEAPARDRPAADKPRKTKRQRRAQENARNQRRNREARENRRRQIPEKDWKRYAGIAKLTNWQYHQWVKDGRKVSKLAHFRKLPHHRSVARAQRDQVIEDKTKESA